MSFTYTGYTILPGTGLKMENKFAHYLFGKQQRVQIAPSNESITSWAIQIIQLIYPQKADRCYTSVMEIEEILTRLERELCVMCNATQGCLDCDNEKRAHDFFEQLPELYRICNTDLQAILEGDPAAKSEYEIVRAYPGFNAVCFYRIAHLLLTLDIPLLPRILTEYAHSVTGIDIHPGAEIGHHLYIDHGTGIVIGESSKIGNYVKLYQGVTLGAMSVAKTMAHTKRHPTVEDHVIIYANATILGGETVIGDHCIIGGNVWITESIAPHSTVYHIPEIEVIVKDTNV